MPTLISRAIVVSGFLVPSLLLGCAQVAAKRSPSGGGGSGGSGSGGSGSGAGGMAVNTTGSGGAGGSTPTGSSTGRGGTSGKVPNCGVKDIQIVRKPANVVLVQDRSGSMKNTPDGQTQSKWQLTTAAMIDAIMKTDGDISWGLKTYPETTNDCPVKGTPDVAVAAANATKVVAAINATTPDGDGTPTGEAIAAASGYLAGVTLPGDKYMVLSTDGDPTCGGITGTVAALRMAAMMGIKTFVIGIGTGSSSGPNLNMMADAGGMPRPVVNPLDTKYYLANSQQQLSQALAAITGQVISCTFALDEVPPVKDGVHVKVNGTEIYLDAARASHWQYTDDSYTGLQVVGPACDEIQAGNANVQIIYDCMTIIPT